MFLVGLTGGIGSGKSTVAAMLRSMDVQVIDADQIARDVVQPGTRAWNKIRRHFGDGILLDDGQMNRSLLGQVIFGDAEKRALLNSITHPEIYRSIMWKCLWLLLAGHQFVVLDLPLLYETKAMLPYMTKVVVVHCTREQQLQRVMARDGYNAQEAERRIQAQLPLEEKCARAHFVVDNTQDEHYTLTQVQHIVHQLKGSYAHWKLRGPLVFLLLALVAWLTAQTFFNR